ncbi:MAG TPA: hypothetical protein VIV15_03625 [Anaerolineales bacterium]
MTTGKDGRLLRLLDIGLAIHQLSFKASIYWNFEVGGVRTWRDIGGSTGILFDLGPLVVSAAWRS